MKNLLTPCKRLLPTLAVTAFLGSSPSSGWAAAAALQEETGALLRRVEAQHHEIAGLEQRLQSGPLAWPAWWGWLGTASVLGLGLLAARPRRRWGSAALRGVHVAPAAAAALPSPTPSREAVAAKPTLAQAPVVLRSATEPAAAMRPRRAPDLVAGADALLTTAGEVEFLASIGLHHGAVQAMEQHLSATAAPAPLAWLELVNLHRSEGDGGPATAAWHRLVAHFPAAATADAEALLDDTEGLEAFPAVLARVQATWSTPLAAEQLSAELMAWPAPLLTLAAGRELLWLLQVCHERAAARPAPMPDTPAAGDAFDRTVLFTAADWVRHLEALEVTPRDQPAAVDIELDVPAWIDEARASVRVGPVEPAAFQSSMSDATTLDEWRSDLFDAATSFERRSPAGRAQGVGR